jgi:hypothetical protein
MLKFQKKKKKHSKSNNNIEYPSSQKHNAFIKIKNEIIGGRVGGGGSKKKT